VSQDLYEALIVFRIEWNEEKKQNELCGDDILFILG
jgi:hypothetical protein